MLRIILIIFSTQIGLVAAGHLKDVTIRVKGLPYIKAVFRGGWEILPHTGSFGSKYRLYDTRALFSETISEHLDLSSKILASPDLQEVAFLERLNGLGQAATLSIYNIQTKKKRSYKFSEMDIEDFTWLFDNSVFISQTSTSSRPGRFLVFKRDGKVSWQNNKIERAIAPVNGSYILYTVDNETIVSHDLRDSSEKTYRAPEAISLRTIIGNPSRVLLENKEHASVVRFYYLNLDTKEIVKILEATNIYYSIMDETFSVHTVCPGFIWINDRLQFSFFERWLKQISWYDKSLVTVNPRGCY